MLNRIKIIAIALLSMILGSLMWAYATGNDAEIIKYVSGKYGKKCYTVGEEHGNIKYPVEFMSLEDCQEYTSKN